jgi:hypothetical protein
LLSKTRTPVAELEDYEALKLQNLFLRAYNQWYVIETAYENGMATSATYGVIFNNVTYAIDGLLGIRTMLRMIAGTYPTMTTTKPNLYNRFFR